MNTPVVDPPADEPSAPGLPGSQTPENPASAGPATDPEPASPASFRWKKLLKFFKTGGGRVGLCACAAALVVAVAIVVLLIRGGDGGTLDGWPEDELLAGVASPEQGEVLSVRQTESALTVYLAEFPADGLDGYLQTLGIPSDGGSPYVAQLDGERLLAVVYDADARRLSLTVTKMP